MASDSSNIHFQIAAQFVQQTGKHLFLTGKAGTGKTTFLKYIMEHGNKKTAVVAPTGVAAMNAGGMTIHSFLNLPFGAYIYNLPNSWGAEEGQLYNRSQLFHKARLSGAKRKLIRELELLIVDEVSMVRADTMDAMDTLLRSIRKSPEPFGGLQLLLIGDLFQLPPVVKDTEWNRLKEIYESPFFFEAMVVKEAAPVCIELEKIYRQSDADFISLLNNVRNNTCTTEDFLLLQKHYQPEFIPPPDENYITLASHNYRADAINQAEIKKLNGTTLLAEAAATGDFPEHTYPAERAIELKEGAQIMFIKNDKGEARRFYNGKIGVIDRIDKAEKEVHVRFPGEENTLLLEKETWRNIRYAYDQEKDRITEEELGTYTQYPVRLAWAVTIHKSQGLTFSKAIIDAGRSFAPGQVYVALSRLTGLEGLVLKSTISASSIQTDARVLAYTNNRPAIDDLQELLEAGRKAFATQSLIRAFGWDKQREEIESFTGSFEKRSFPDRAKGYELFLDLSKIFANMAEVGARFSLQLRQLLEPGSEDFPQLKERTAAAVGWFLQTLEEKVITPLLAHEKEMRVKPRIKKYMEELRLLRVMLEQKKVSLEQVNTVTAALAENRSMEEVMERVAQMQQPATAMEPDATEQEPDVLPSKEKKAKPEKIKTPKGETKRISLELFREGKSIPEIAKERSLAISTIETHLSSFISTGEVQVEELVPAEKLAVIVAAVKEKGNALTPLKSYLGGNYSFGEIRAVVAWLEREENQPTS